MSKRRRGSRHAARGSSHVTFERLVDRALAGIPSPFREHLAEVAIVIDDEPSPAQLRDNDIDPDEGLYVIYEEVPITVIHELAHHLGIDDDRLGELGVD